MYGAEEKSLFAQGYASSSWSTHCGLRVNLIRVVLVLFITRYKTTDVNSLTLRAVQPVDGVIYSKKQHCHLSGLRPTLLYEAVIGWPATNKTSSSKLVSKNKHGNLFQWCTKEQADSGQP